MLTSWTVLPLAAAYRHFLKESKLNQRISKILGDLNIRDVEDLQTRGHEIRQLIIGSRLPQDLEAEITYAYDKLVRDTDVSVAVRSSATAEDLPEASFAGQQETFLNVHGHAALLDACRRCFASLFTDRAISYRIDKGFDQQQMALSIGVQRNGALRPCFRGCHVFHRHGKWLPRRCAD